MTNHIQAELVRELIANQNRSTTVEVPDKVKVLIGIGAALVGAAVAYDASIEGVERFEGKAGTAVDKYRAFKNRKNKSQPPSAG